MDIFKVIAFTILSLILVITLKQTQKEIGVLVAIIASTMLLVSVLSGITSVIDLLDELIEKSGINKGYLEVILKITGIAYVVEFGKNICIDAGESALGTKLEIAGKVSIVVITLPVIVSVIQTVLQII